MILDSGICTVFRWEDMALSGEMPRPGYRKIAQGWYGELSFETSPVHQTEGRKELRVDGRIRILQNRAIRQNDVVALCQVDDFSQVDDEALVYKITRAYHGRDDNSAALITDLTLEVTRP